MFRRISIDIIFGFSFIEMNTEKLSESGRTHCGFSLSLCPEGGVEG